MKRSTVALCAAMLFTAHGIAAAETGQSASATFLDSSGNRTGSATLSQTPAGVLINVEIDGLPPSQWVAFHVHETGACDAATHHESAGGHFNPGGRQHGFFVDGGPHAGDMPNLWVGPNGTARAQVFNADVTLGEGENGISRRALMIHAVADDYESQPAGNAGTRLACGVIERE